METSVRKSARAGALVTAGIVFALIAGGEGQAQAQAQAKQVLRYSNAASPSDYHVRGVQVFKDELEKSLPGRFDIQIFPSGAMFKQGTEMAALQRGNLELAHFNFQDLTPQHPDLSLFTVPYVIRDVAHMNKIIDSPIGTEIRNAVAAKSDIQLLAPFFLGARVVGTRTVRNVRTPADLAGVKMRMPPANEWLFLAQAIGAVGTPLGIQELYLALKTGTVDAQDAAFSTLRTVKLEEVLKEISLTDHQIQALFLSVSGKIYNAWPADVKAKVNAAANVAAKWNDENRFKEDAESVAYFKTKGIVITNPDKEAFKTYSMKQYLASPYSKAWTPGMLERVAAIK